MAVASSHGKRLATNYETNRLWWKSSCKAIYVRDECLLSNGSEFRVTLSETFFLLLSQKREHQFFMSPKAILVWFLRKLFSFLHLRQNLVFNQLTQQETRRASMIHRNVVLSSKQRAGFRFQRQNQNWVTFWIIHAQNCQGFCFENRKLFDNHNSRAK